SARLARRRADGGRRAPRAQEAAAVTLRRAVFPHRFGGQVRALFAAAGLLAVAGCTAETPPPPTLAPLPPAVQENADGNAATPADQIARGTWWQVFHDPQLDGLEARIDVTNDTLKAQQARFAQARAAVAIAGAAKYPLVTTAPEITVGTQSGNRN